MNLFDPRTFSTDWEVMVVDKLERCVSNDKLTAFAGVLRRDSGLPIKSADDLADAAKKIVAAVKEAA